MICAPVPSQIFPEKVDLRSRALYGRMAYQIGRRPYEDRRRLSGVVAITFRPGDRTAAFLGEKLFRPLGASVLVALNYAPIGEDCILSGIRGRLTADGTVEYGIDGRREFQHDIVSTSGNRRYRPLSADRNPSLAEMLLRMDTACERYADRAIVAAPRLPRAWYGFAQDQVPAFERTPALEQRAADGIGLTLERLAANPPELLDRLLRQTWDAAILRADDPVNPTGLILVEAELCTRYHNALRAFEDFRDLVGTRTWNPASKCPPLRYENPTAALLEAHGIEPRFGWEDGIEARIVETLLSEFRSALGEASSHFDDEDLHDALVDLFEPVTAASEALPQLRKQLTEYWSACVTEADLRRGARYPDLRLFASGAGQIQICRQRPTVDALLFNEEDLGRKARLDARRIEWRRTT